MEILKKFAAVGIVPLLFLFFGILTLRDYGINWDEPIHFNRGQGYLYYFVTGKIEQDIPITQRPSFFLGYNVKALYDWDGGHPVTSDVLAAVSNLIFYQLLGLTGDIDGYHLYNLFTSALAILIVTVFAYKVYGSFASLISGLTLSTFPLFFAESHFNIKDPPETAFFSLTIFAFWMSLKRGNWKWLLLSAVGAGLALGTKLNIIFIPFVIAPYLVIRYFPALRDRRQRLLGSIKKLPKKYIIILGLFPIISFLIFFGTWPFLWDNPVENIQKVAGYYKNIATGFDYQPVEYSVFGVNFYAPYWLIITTPPWIIVLLIIGTIVSLRKDDKTYTNKLWLLWFTIPILRVMVPGTTIYGGIRQIMEFSPAMALLSGVGANYVVSSFKNLLNLKRRNYIIESVSVILLIVCSVSTLAKIHPNENVYFNFLIGGLSGAKERNIPSWGNSYGNAYWQAIQWINKNAEQNASVALVQGTGQNVPLIQLRPDIDFSGRNWSGINRKGEYLMELIYESSRRAYPYVWDYIEIFLDPVYEVKVDGVAIAKVWKNDLEHTKLGMRRKEMIINEKGREIKSDNITLDLGKVFDLTRLVIEKGDLVECKEDGDIELSQDGFEWVMEKEQFGTEHVRGQLDARGGGNFYFPGKPARFIRIYPGEDSCFSLNSVINIYALE